MKKSFFVLILALFSYANEPKINANITALKYEQNALFIGTDSGEVLEYDLKSKKIQKLIKLPAVQNHYEKGLGARIHSLDVYKNSFLVVSEGDFGTQNLNLCPKNASCSTVKAPFTNVKKAFFINENTALLALLSADIKLINLKEFLSLNSKSATKEFKFSLTSLNDITLDETRQKLLSATESGELKVFDLQSWRVLANYDKIHKDFLYQIDFKNGVIVSCGNDKKVGIVRDNEQKFIPNPNVIYSCALNTNGQIAAYTIFKQDGKNKTELIDTKSLKKIASFENENFSPEFIIFLNEKEFLLSNYEGILLRSLK